MGSTDRPVNSLTSIIMGVSDPKEEIWVHSFSPPGDVPPIPIEGLLDMRLDVEEDGSLTVETKWETEEQAERWRQATELSFGWPDEEEHG